MSIEIRRITDRDEWLRWREQDITASDVGALFGLSSWTTPLQLWARKTGRMPSAPRETMLMRRGRWLESSVLAALAESYPRDRLEKQDIYIRDSSIRLGATPDAMLGRRLVECKVVARPVFETWDDGEPPMPYQLQCLTGCMLTDAAAGLIACLVIDTYSAELVTFHVERVPAAEERIRAAVAQFWTDAEAGVMPAADYGEDLDLLQTLYPARRHSEPVDLNGDNVLPPLLIERESHKQIVKAANARIDAIDAEIVDKLKGAPAAICGPWKITSASIHVKERIQQAYDYMRLTITRRKEEAA